MMDDKEFRLASLITRNLSRVDNIYPNIRPLSKDQLELMYEDYIGLINRFDSDIDKDFFCKSFMPLTTKSPLIYLDFSGKIPIVFELSYFFREPYHWFKIPVVDNVLGFLLENKVTSLDVIKMKELDYVSWFNFNEIRTLLDLK